MRSLERLSWGLACRLSMTSRSFTASLVTVAPTTAEQQCPGVPVSVGTRRPKKSGSVEMEACKQVRIFCSYFDQGHLVGVFPTSNAGWHAVCSRELVPPGFGTASREQARLDSNGVAGSPVENASRSGFFARTLTRDTWPMCFQRQTLAGSRFAPESSPIFASESCPKPGPKCEIQSQKTRPLRGHGHLAAANRFPGERAGQIVGPGKRMAGFGHSWSAQQASQNVPTTLPKNENQPNSRQSAGIA
jgi:hypothetical protein